MKIGNHENVKLDEYEQDLEDNFDKLIELPLEEEKRKIKMLTEAERSSSICLKKGCKIKFYVI